MGPSSSKKSIPKQLLSLDGGGVKGISSLLILDKIMKEIMKRENTEGIDSSEEERLPVDYFHLAAGTSTGGLIALMLFRLRMSVPQVIARYRTLAEDVFTPRVFGISLHKLGALGYNIGNPILKLKAVFFESRFSDGPLKEAIDIVVAGHGVDDEEKAQKGKALLTREGTGKMIMCSTLADKGESILFRSYSAPPDAEPISSQATLALMETISISTAACATSAAPTFLPVVEWKGLKFWDGGLLNNNPIHQLWAARYDLAIKAADSADSADAAESEDLASPEPPIGCIVSLGTSWSSAVPSSPFRFINTVSRVVPFTTNTEAKNLDFRRELNRINARLPPKDHTAYFRFNTPTVDETFNLDDYQQMARLEKLTEVYLEVAGVHSDIMECAKKLHHIGMVPQL
ncbi:FabD/lysophospholipase-like protein [Cadophora sp. DSE1049]|nr:FabD/lysophospholipase-like protein [Cadophora sp. DSE1049]